MHLSVYSLKLCACHQWPYKTFLQYPHSRNTYSHPSTNYHNSHSCPKMYSYLPSGRTDPVILSDGNRKPCFGSHIANPSFRTQIDSWTTLVESFLYNFLPTLVKQIQPSQDPRYPSRQVTI